MRSWWLAGIALTVAACGSDRTTGVTPLLPPPSNLSYTLEPSGTSGQPNGILLAWDFDNSSHLSVWNVYSRASAGDQFALRGSTTSNTFHDNGIPHLQYYVTAMDDQGGESLPSDTVTVDERLALDAPDSLSSTTLDSAIALTWTDNAFLAAPNAFKDYRVYSASYDIDQGTCGTDWALEGTTVSPEFVVGALANGVPECFGISAVSVEGYESLWSPLQADTPRPDSRNIVLQIRQLSDAGSGFRFESGNQLGVTVAGSDPAADFVVEQNGTGGLQLRPVRTGTVLAPYGSGPVADLTSITVAPPDADFSTAPLVAQPGLGYVFRTVGADGHNHYGAVRLTHVGQSLVILDWSYQTDWGNPELVIGAGVRTAAQSGVAVSGAR